MVCLFQTTGTKQQLGDEAEPSLAHIYSSDGSDVQINYRKQRWQRG